MTFEDKKLCLNNRFGVLEVEDEDVKKKKKNRAGMMVKNMKKMKDWTFFLLYPSTIIWDKLVGKIWMAIEKMGLSIIGVRLMCGSSKFITTHFSRDGRDHFPDVSAQHLTRWPFIAMILEGENAINKALKLTSAETNPFWPPGMLEAYSSHSYECAVEDYEFWFGMDADNWKEVAAAGNHLAFAFPDGTSCGPTTKVLENILRVERLIFLKPNYVDNFYHKDMSFVLIRPLAFQKRCVGELVSIIEHSFFHFKGLKLVRRSEVPHINAWLANGSLSSEIKEDEYGIAMLARHIKAERIHIVNKGDGCIRKVDNTVRTEICSNLIYIGKAGDRENIKEFFEFGCVSWVDPISRDKCGGSFVATLSSLQFEECEA